MPSFLRKSSFSAALAATSLLLSAPFSAVRAQTTQPWGGVCVVQGVATIQGLECLLANVLGVAVSGLGLIGFVMFILGAFRYLLSGGNAKGVETGKSTITYAIIGLVVALSAFMILQIISTFTGVESILQFHIPRSTDGIP